MKEMEEIEKFFGKEYREEWEKAYAWANKANEDKDECDTQPKWKWDCNFKLDFDGPLLSVNSRFWPPRYSSGNFWEGNVSIFLLDKEILKKEFKADTIDELRPLVEEYVKDYTQKLAVKLALFTQELNQTEQCKSK